jgi:hypothetical protein
VVFEDMRDSPADDDNKYYRATLGEILNGQYKVTHARSGKGVFSNVVKA